MNGGYTGQQNWLKTMDILNMAEGKNYVIWIRLWNGKAKGNPTVIHWKGPGQVWDGTSCFNFTKEMISRYHNGNIPSQNVFQDGKLTLNQDVKKVLDSSSFLYYLLWHQPTSICYNIHRTGEKIYFFKMKRKQ